MRPRGRQAVERVHADMPARQSPGVQAKLTPRSRVWTAVPRRAQVLHTCSPCRSCTRRRTSRWCQGRYRSWYPPSSSCPPPLRRRMPPPTAPAEHGTRARRTRAAAGVSTEKTRPRAGCSADAPDCGRARGRPLHAAAPSAGARRAPAALAWRGGHAQGGAPPRGPNAVCASLL